VPSITSNVTQQHSQSNPTRKPEDHGQKLNPEDGEFVSSIREVQRSQRQVNDGQKRPYCGEEEELCLRWGPRVVACASPVMDD
jgi:hypothetical protein